MKYLGALVPLGAVAAVLSGIAFRSDEREPTSAMNQIHIRPKDGGCVVKAMEGPEMMQVRGVVSPGIELEGAGGTTANVRTALLERYGTHVTESATPMGYAWWWDGERWVLVCMSASAFEVDLGEYGSVLVESQDAESAPASVADLSGFALRSADGEAAAVSNQILLRPKDGGCVVKAMEGPEMTEVREVLLPKLELQGTDEALTARVRKALLERYGSRVTESAALPGYVWMWDRVLERWIIVCLSSASEFEVDFGECGSVVVESHGAEPMPARTE